MKDNQLWWHGTEILIQLILDDSKVNSELVLTSEDEQLIHGEEKPIILVAVKQSSELEDILKRCHSL